MTRLPVMRARVSERGTAAFGLALIVLFASLAVSSAPARGQVLINEVLYDPEGPDTGLEFVELLNCGREGVLLTGWVLETGNGGSTDDWTVEWIGGELDYLEPGAIFLIGEADVESVPDYVTPLDLQNGPDGVRLSDGIAPVDVIGWGEPLFQEYYEGAPAADVMSGRSLSRSPDCYDSDMNTIDLIGSEPTPGARNTLSSDLSIRVRHAGARVFGDGEDVRLDCVIVNGGALAVESHAAAVGMAVDGSAESVCEATVDTNLEPR
ncbi:MAG: lamin tail domain-containing protein, partial [Candidatus Eisenbacteria bacterium]|nr:lamin tail domain-containing protein [Candidatus Eisenbacteria bacterium]